MVGDEVRITRWGDPLVGVGDESAFGVALLRQQPDRQVAGPVVAGVPAWRRRQALQVIVRPAQRHSAWRDQRDVASVIGHRHVLLRHLPTCCGSDKGIDRTRLVHRQRRRDDVVVGIETGPAQRDRVSRLGAERAVGHA